MNDAVCKVVIWNIEWRRLSSSDGRELRRRIDEQSPDVLCVTEGHGDFLPEEGFGITSHPDYGYPQKPGRRKALLWSRQPWTAVDAVGSEIMPPGRFIRGTTMTPVGPLDLIGVCIPWRDAHVSSGHRNRSAWEDHLRYLDGLDQLARQAGSAQRIVLLGDFNQHFPRRTVPERVAARLFSILNPILTLATTGNIPGVGHQAIDHLAHTADLVVSSARGLSNIAPSGRKLTDHFGLAIDLVAAEQHSPAPATLV